MSSTAASYSNFRVFDLPWTPSVEEERRFRRILGAALGLFIGFAIVIPLLPDRPRTAATAPAVPERIVEFILEQPKPKPKPVVVPPPPVVQPQVERPVERPVVGRSRWCRPSRGRIRARRQPRPACWRCPTSWPNCVTSTSRPTCPRSRSTPAPASARASTARCSPPRSVRAAAASPWARSARALAAVRPGSRATPRPRCRRPRWPRRAAAEAQRSGSSAKAARTREEIELVFDKNKSAIYALYSRALRENPALQGKVVLEVTIAPERRSD